MEIAPGCRKNYRTRGSRTRKIWLAGYERDFIIGGRVSNPLPLGLSLSLLSILRASAASASLAFCISPTVLLYSFAPLNPFDRHSFKKLLRFQTETQPPYAHLPPCTYVFTYSSRCVRTVLFTPSHERDDSLPARFSLNHPLMHTPVASTSIPNARPVLPEARTDEFLPLSCVTPWRLSIRCASLNSLHHWYDFSRRYARRLRVASLSKYARR